MKNFLKINTVLVLAALLAMASCAKEKSTADAGGYYCPMHPTVESATTGICPVCNMELVAKNSQGSGELLSAGELAANESPTQKIIAQVKTIRGSYSAHDHTIVADGIVAYDTRAIRTVTSRLSGRIEELVAASGFTLVKKGQVLATVYSQEAIEAQRSFLETSKDPGSALNKAARKRLELLGIGDDLLASISASKVLTTIPLISPVDGYLLSDLPDNTSSAPAEKKSGMMDASAAVEKVQVSGALLRKGDYVTAGQNLFYLIEKNRLRLDLNLKESDFSSIKAGQPITGTTKNGKSFNGTILLIEPDGKEQNAFRKARVYLSVPNLAVGELVSVQIAAGAEEGLWLPAASVLDLGSRSVVFVKNEDHFIPKDVITGAKTNGKIRIFKGLSSADEVAAVASMLADSDGFVTDNSGQLIFTVADVKESPDDSKGNKNALMMSDRAIQLAGVQALKVSTSTLRSTIDFNARISGDPARREKISTLIPGRIEKFYFRETGRMIKKDEIVAEIHSPEILMIVAELRLSLKKGQEGLALAAASRNKLKRYGFKESEITVWEKADEMPETISVRASRSGVITEVLSGPGKTVSEGSPLLTIEDLTSLWAEAEVYPEDAQTITEGKNVVVSIPGVGASTVSGFVEQILPAFKENTQITIARVRLKNNNGQYRPGQIARVTLTSEARESILVPTDAVVADGHGSRVFVITGKNSFEPRRVETGTRIDGKVEVTTGLRVGEMIAGSGAYLLNSQFLLRQGGEHQH